MTRVDGPPARRKSLPFFSGTGPAGDGTRFGPTVRLADDRVARMERAACCLCGQAGEEHLLTVQDWRYGLSVEPFAIVRCRECGLARLNPRPVPDDMGHFYPGNYYDRRKRDEGPGDAPRARRVRDEALREQAGFCGKSSPGRSTTRARMRT